MSSRVYACSLSTAASSTYVLSWVLRFPCCCSVPLGAVFGRWVSAERIPCSNLCFRACLFSVVPVSLARVPAHAVLLDVAVYSAGPIGSVAPQRGQQAVRTPVDGDSIVFSPGLSSVVCLEEALLRALNWVCVLFFSFLGCAIAGDVCAVKKARASSSADVRFACSTRFWFCVLEA